MTWGLSMAPALLGSASLVWFKWACLASVQLCASSYSGTKGEGMLVSWWRSRGRGTGTKHATTFKASAQSSHTWHLCTFHWPKQINNQAQSQMCRKVHPTYSKHGKDRERKDNRKQTITIFHSVDDLHSLAAFSLLHALLAQWTFFIVLSTSYISQINFYLTLTWLLSLSCTRK